ncbi:MAG: hypothetical protein JJE47_06210 [Acidimicrobiia bacterium]|nr:hypothetical protein [Acidimicrobiia bacterium]
MSFFDVPAQPPDPESDAEPSRSPWDGPPRGVLPGYSSQRATIFRTDQSILFVDDFRVYPIGLMFSLNLVLRNRNEDLAYMPWDVHWRRRRVPDPLPDDLLRFGILFADGSKWTNLGGQIPDPRQEPHHPYVMGQGGGGGDHSWRTDFWMWPLPTDRPLTFVASWPAYEVPESTAIIDGAELRRCAEAAEVIWPS